MTRIWLRKYEPGWSSHIPVLIKIFEISEGPILELGTGVFSTPLLHTLSLSKNRSLTSYENNPYYVERHRDFITDKHQIILVDNWENINIEDTRWGFAFVDHAPEERRKLDVKRLANNAQYIVLHDTEPRNEALYKYSEIYPLFKYRFDYTTCYPHTTVLSNFVDLKNLKI